MNLLLLFDHRYRRKPDGTIYSPSHYNYLLFARRYLQVFDHVTVLTRVMPESVDADTDKSGSNEMTARGPEYSSKCPSEYSLGPDVTIVPAGDFSGPLDFWKQRHSVKSHLQHYLNGDAGSQSAVMAILPGIIGSTGLSLLKQQGKPYGVEVVGDPYDVYAPGTVKHPLRPFFRYFFSSQLRRQCGGACAAAYVTEHALQRRYPSQPAAHSTHYSSIELHDSAFVPTFRTWNQEVKSFTIVSVGSMAQMYKGFDVLVDAVASCAKNGLDLKLVIIGEGKFRQDLEARVAQHGLQERVTFRGQLPAGEAVLEELERADLFILASRTEGIPRAMIEAMARALPCIGTTVGGIPELLPSEDMIPPDDSMALAQKISEVVTDQHRMGDMSKRNLAKAREYHDDILSNRRRVLYQHVRDCTEAWLKDKRR